LLYPHVLQNPDPWLWRGNCTASFPQSRSRIWHYASEIKIHPSLRVFPVENTGSFMAGNNSRGTGKKNPGIGAGIVHANKSKSHPDMPKCVHQKKNDADHAGELVSSNRYFQTTAAITAPMTGATRNSQSCASAVPPATTAGPRLRAGFTEVPVTGIVTI
jgi:hypothetical protein